MAKRHDGAGSQHLALETSKPELVAEFLDHALEPEVSIAQAARRVGMNERTAQDLMGRFLRRYQPVVGELRKVKSAELLGKIEDRLSVLLDAMTPEKIAAAPLRDQAVTFGILSEKRQLLRGEPTQIIDDGERRQLNELIPLVLKEAQRRGMTVDLGPSEYGPAEVHSRPPEEQAKRTYSRKRG